MKRALPWVLVGMLAVAWISDRRWGYAPARPVRAPVSHSELMGEMRVGRMPDGNPDTPAPSGGKFVPFTLTVDGKQTFSEETPPGPRWVFFLADGRVVIHAVRVAD